MCIHPVHRDTKEQLSKIIGRLKAIAVERYEDEGAIELGDVADTPEEFVETSGPGASPLSVLSWCQMQGSSGDTEETMMAFRLFGVSSWNPLWYRYIKGGWPKGTKKYKDDRGRHLYVVPDQSTYEGESSYGQVCVCYLLIAPGTWFIWTWLPPEPVDLGPTDYYVNYSASIFAGVIVKYDSASKKYFYVSKEPNCDEPLPLLNAYAIDYNSSPNLFPPNYWKPLFGPPPGGTNLEPNQDPVYDPSIWDYWPLNLIRGVKPVLEATDDPIEGIIRGPRPFQPIYSPPTIHP